MNEHIMDAATEIIVKLGESDMTVGDLVTLETGRHYSSQSRGFR